MHSPYVFSSRLTLDIDKTKDLLRHNSISHNMVNVAIQIVEDYFAFATLNFCIAI